MKRSGSGSLASLFPVKRQTSGPSGGGKKAEHGRETRRGLGPALPSSSGKGTSLDALLAGLDNATGQAGEVTSPPPSRRSGTVPPAPVRAEPPVDLCPSSPKANLAPDASQLSSPFAAWRHSSFEGGCGSEGGARAAAAGEEEGDDQESFDLGTPFAAGVGPSRATTFQLPVPFFRRVEAAAVTAREGGAGLGLPPLPLSLRLQQAQQEAEGPFVAAKQGAPENDENSINALVSPARPPPRRSAAALLTPEKDGGLLPPPSAAAAVSAAAAIQPMPSLSSWMVPATKPPQQRPSATKACEAAVEEVLACLNFDPSQPRKLQRAPSPLDRLLGDLGDSDFAPSVALWDQEQSQQQQGAATAL